MDRPSVAKNPIPKAEVVSVFCGVDTRERRCGHIGRKVLSESLFCFPPENGQSGGQLRNPGRGHRAGSSLQSSAIGPSPFYRKVFFHGDILQARSLPAMDSDALVNPWWSVEVEGEVRIGS